MDFYHYCYRRCRVDVYQFGGLSLWLVFRCLPATVLGAAMLTLLWTASAHAQPDAESDVNDVESGQLLLRDPADGRYRVALMQASKVHFDISGMIATVRVEQSFRNDTDRYVEGVYAFPLPENAAVRFMEMRIGERRIVGKIKEKAQAKRIYEAARKAGKKASLVAQQRPNLFTNRVANIGPGEKITVSMEYVQSVEFDAGTFSLRFPMTITPRYMPGTPLETSAVLNQAPGSEQEILVLNPLLGWARRTDQVPDAHAISPRLHRTVGSDHAPLNPIEITATLDMGMPLANVASPYHDIVLSRRAGVYSIRLTHSVSEMDRDFVLHWQPVTGATPQAALFTEQVGDEYYGLLMLVPPAAERLPVSIPREIIFVVDTSGSMGGVSIKQARASVSQALQQLRPQDRFNIIAFNSTHRALYRNSMPATAHHVQLAQEFVRQLDASGGTEMLPALRAALPVRGAQDTPQNHGFLRQVIFITDGAVGNETALFAELAGRLGDSRLFTVGIGAAPNSWFMRKAAQFGRGTHTHIGDLNEVGAKMAALFEQLARPAAVNLAIQWPVTVEAWPARVPDLYMGKPVSVAVNFGTSPPQGELLVSAEIDGREWRQRLQLAPGENPQATAGHKGVASLWARAKIDGLLDQKIAGRDGQAVRADVLPIALRHHLLSPYTSFVAVEEVVARPVDTDLVSQSVPNSRPRGQSPQHFAYPRTATTGPAKAWFGLFALFLALLVRLVRQPEVDHIPAPVAT